jgi:HlyD family secretion protein
MSNMTTEKDSNIANILGAGSGAGRGRRLVRYAAWLLLAAGIVFAVLRLGAGKRADGQEYKTEAARRGNLVVTVAATGTLQPTNQVDVGTELSGIVRTVEADFNDVVKTGQVLAKLDTLKLETQVQQYKASLESAAARVRQVQATVRESGNDLARIREAMALSGGRIPSQHDLGAAEAAHERALAEETAAKAAVSQAEATLNTVEADLAKAVIYSPINGIVLKRSIEPGQTVAASLQSPVLFTLAEDLTRMELKVDVDEADVGRVKKGQRAVFNVDGYPDASFPAKIKQVRYGSKIVSGVVTYEAILSVDNPDLLLRPGMTATVKITVNEISNAVLVPNAALRFTPPAKEEESSSASDSIIGKLFPRPARTRPQPKETAKTDRKKAKVWTLKEGRLSEIQVVTGESDGIMTEITGGEISHEAPLVVDIVARNQK